MVPVSPDWWSRSSIGITLEDVAGMKEKEKEQEKAMRTPRNTFIVNLGYGWITSRVEMRSGTYKWKGGPEYKVAYNWVGKKGYGFGLECAAFSTDFPEETVTLGYVAPSLVYCQKIDEKFRKNLRLSTLIVKVPGRLLRTCQ